MKSYVGGDQVFSLNSIDKNYFVERCESCVTSRNNVRMTH